MFKFNFKAINDDSKLSYYVYSESKDLLLLFLKQHQLENGAHAIQVVADNNTDDFHLLQLYTFKSNFSNETYKVATCEQFIMDCIDKTCNELENVLCFGPIMLRNDIEFVKIIAETIENLPYRVTVLDYAIADDTAAEMEELTERWKHYINSPSMGESYSVASIYDAIHDESYVSNVQPITIESYISYFVDMITDSFK